MQADWATAEGHFRPMLYSALRRMAAAGHAPKRLEDSRDLIVDFFLEQWPGLRKRYRAELARPETYVYRAFILYARPRLRRLRAWNNSLMDAAQLADRVVAAPPVAADQLLDVKAGLAELPAEERELFMRVINDQASLRDLAAEYRMTRYRVRELICDAFGRLSVSLETQDQQPENDRKIALALWRDGLTPKEAAKAAGTTTIAVQEYRNRTMELMSAALRRLPHRPGHSSQTRAPLTSKGASSMSNINKLISDAILRNTDDYWTKLKHKQHEVFKYLEDHDLELKPEVQEILDQDPEVYLRLLEALGESGELELTPEELRSAQQLIEARDDDENLVGTTFGQVLVPGLSENLLNLSQHFLSAHRVDEEELPYFHSRNDVKAAQVFADAVDEFVSYGLTPMTFVYAGLAPLHVWNDRLSDNPRPATISPAIVPPAAPIRLTLKPNPQSSISVEDTVREISMLIECDNQLAQALYEYCFAIAQDQHPYFWHGFEAIRLDDSTLSLNKIDEKPIEERWKPRVEARRLEMAH